MENELSKSGDAQVENGIDKISYNPDSVFHNKNISYFGGAENLKNQYKEFTKATGEKKWLNMALVVIIFLLIEAIVIANNPPTRNFVCSLFKIKT